MVDVGENKFCRQSGTIPERMRQNTHEVEIHAVDQQLLVHKQTGLSKVVLLE